MSAVLGSVIFSARIPLPLVCSCRKKAKNFYVAGRRLTRLYLVGYGEFVSAVLGSVGAFGSGSPPAGLLLPEKGKELLRRGAALSAPLLCGIRRICVRGFWQCRGFWLGLSSRWLVLERKKAENCYIAGRRLTRLYFAGYTRLVSAVFGSAGAFGSDSPYCWPVLLTRLGLTGKLPLARGYFSRYTGGNIQKERLSWTLYCAWPPPGTRPPSAGCLWRCCGPFSTPRR